MSRSGDKPAEIKPGLATQWHVDEADSKRWIFTLRQGVKWHDGCPFTADDVVCNFDYSGNEKSPQFIRPNRASAAAREAEEREPGGEETLTADQRRSVDKDRSEHVTEHGFCGDRLNDHIFTWIYPHNWSYQLNFGN